MVLFALAVFSTNQTTPTHHTHMVQVLLGDNPRFKSPDVALMRHAKDDGNTPCYLIRDSVEILKHCIEILASQLKGRRIQVLHSPQRRAYLTAMSAYEKFDELGFDTNIAERLWLDVSKCTITDKNIQREIVDNPDDFLLLVSHHPDIEHFLRIRDDRDESKIRNCAIFAQKFEIHPDPAS
jgi:phosphohistidine phosphatase SixA